VQIKPAKCAKRPTIYAGYLPRACNAHIFRLCVLVVAHGSKADSPRIVLTVLLRAACAWSSPRTYQNRLSEHVIITTFLLRRLHHRIIQHS
jgi:hypothetical protein